MMPTCGTSRQGPEVNVGKMTTFRCCLHWGPPGAQTQQDHWLCLGSQARCHPTTFGGRLTNLGANGQALSEPRTC